MKRVGQIPRPTFAPIPQGAAQTGSALLTYAYTPFPNRLLDEVMATLNGSEWRLLCALVRGTLGWKDERRGGRRLCARLSRRELAALTGHNPATLSRALDGLVRRRFLLVRDEAGRELPSPTDRRRAQGALRYELAPQSWKGDGPSPILDNTAVGVPLQKATGPSRLMQQGFRDEAVAKGNTIKERKRKYKEKQLNFATGHQAPNLQATGPKANGVANSLWATAQTVFEVVAEPTGAHQPLPLSNAPTKETALSPMSWQGDETVAMVWSLYTEAYRRHRKDEPGPPALAPADYQSLRRLGQTATPAEISQWLEKFFLLDWPRLVQDSHSLPTFASSWQLVRLTSQQGRLLS